MNNFNRWQGVVWLLSVLAIGCLGSPGVEPPYGDDDGDENTGYQMDGGTAESVPGGKKGDLAGAAGAGATSTGAHDRAESSAGAGGTWVGTSGTCFSSADGGVCVSDAGRCGCVRPDSGIDGGVCNCVDSGDDSGVRNDQIISSR